MWDRFLSVFSEKKVKIMAVLEKLKKISDETGGIITTREAVNQGISRAMLSKLCNQGSLERIAQGQYILQGEMEDELLSISLRSQNIIFSHETALYLHGLSDRTPYFHSVTAPSNCVPPKSMREVCKSYYIKPELFEVGREEVNSPAGNLIPVYDIDRTICDVIRCRNKMGKETFLYAIREYAASPEKDLNRLGKYAEAFKIAGLVHRYMEVIL